MRTTKGIGELTEKENKKKIKTKERVGQGYKEKRQYQLPFT